MLVDWWGKEIIEVGGTHVFEKVDFAGGGDLGVRSEV